MDQLLFIPITVHKKLMIVQQSTFSHIASYYATIIITLVV